MGVSLSRCLGLSLCKDAAVSQSATVEREEEEKMVRAIMVELQDEQYRDTVQENYTDTGV
jgi:hypothetical protein